MVNQIHRSAIVPFRPQQMYDLVNDVEGYPMRFAWCADARVMEHGDDFRIARLDLRFAGMTQRFTTRNVLHPYERIEMHLVDGPLQMLEGIFSFRPLGAEGCQIELQLSFEFKGRLWGRALRMGFQGIANHLMDDFCAEAKRAYD